MQDGRKEEGEKKKAPRRKVQVRMSGKEVQVPRIGMHES
jgi:hypothetical protein